MIAFGGPSGWRGLSSRGLSEGCTLPHTIGETLRHAHDAYAVWPELSVLNERPEEGFRETGNGKPTTDILPWRAEDFPVGPDGTGATSLTLLPLEGPISRLLRQQISEVLLIITGPGNHGTGHHRSGNQTLWRGDRPPAGSVLVGSLGGVLVCGEQC